MKDLANAIVSQDGENDSHCYVAASNYNDPCTAAKFCDFRLYNRALSEEEVATMYYPNDEALAQADANSLQLEQTQDITSDFYLPANGVYGSTITWSSDNEAVVVGEKITDP